MDCRVVVEAAVPVYDVESEDEAIRIAISKTGEMLNPDLNYVEISMSDRHCPHCGEGMEPAFIAADESLVALELEMTVFNVERDEHAARIARKEIGQRLENIPLAITQVETIPEEDDEAEDHEAEDDTADHADEDASPDQSADATTDDSADHSDGDSGTDDDSSSNDDDVLPEFDDLLE